MASWSFPAWDTRCGLHNRITRYRAMTGILETDGMFDIAMAMYDQVFWNSSVQFQAINILCVNALQQAMLCKISYELMSPAWLAIQEDLTFFLPKNFRLLNEAINRKQLTCCCI